jgi:hypothetical protein
VCAHRTIGFLRKQMTTDEQATENHSLYLFLAPQNSITMNLKTELQQINGYLPTAPQACFLVESLDQSPPLPLVFCSHFLCLFVSQL